MQQILAGRYVEMWDFQFSRGDNVVVQQHLEDMQGSLGSNLVQIASVSA